MRKNFLRTLKKEERLELVEPSKEIRNSYLHKSHTCLQSAKLLRQNALYETSISMSYYAMYNLLLALLFNTGIKCENHSGSILLLKVLFGENELHAIISQAKEERIDKQYYVTADKDEITKEIADELLKAAEDFILKAKVVLGNMNNKAIEKIRKRFTEVVE